LDEIALEPVCPLLGGVALLGRALIAVVSPILGGEDACLARGGDADRAGVRLGSEEEDDESESELEESDADVLFNRSGFRIDCAVVALGSATESDRFARPSLLLPW
jgi:hypothetical protein